MSERIQHAAELAARLMCMKEFPPESWEPNRYPHIPSKVAQDVDKLLRLSASLRGIHERQSNGYKAGLYGERLWMADTRREKRLVQAVTDTLVPYGLKWRHQTDPMGAAVCIMFPGGVYNFMGAKEAGWYV